MKTILSVVVKGNNKPVGTNGLSWRYFKALYSGIENNLYTEEEIWKMIWKLFSGATAYVYINYEYLLCIP